MQQQALLPLGDTMVAPSQVSAQAVPLQKVPSLEFYDRFIVAFSGGKDSLAVLLNLLEQGVPREKIELWHHEIDGREGRVFMDWPSTPGYCRAIGRAFGIATYFSWKEGGFEREMLRDNTATAATKFETPTGEIKSAGGTSGKLNTRLKFPQVSADLSVRWCSSYLKVDVGAIALRNQDRFNNSTTLFLTGERAQESSARAKYKAFEPHRTDARDGASKRHVDQWRSIHSWSEKQVWDIIARWKINVHPAYRLGWGRLSCRHCIFGSANQWASAKKIDRASVETVANYETQFGTTIDRNIGILEKAAKGTPYPATDDAAVVAEALDPNWDRPIFVDEWVMPAGAFGEGAGPT